MRLLPTIICTLLLLNGCAGGIPEPVNYPHSKQQKMQASHHWEVLAKDLANRINNELIITDNIETAVFVKPTCGDESRPCGSHQTSSFNEAFRDLLITNLVNYGIPTHNQSTQDAIEIQYKVQIVRHSANRIRTFKPGVLTAISAAIVVLRDAPTELLILASGVAADFINYNLTKSGNYEIIITTSMVNDDTYLFRASDIYYINDKDFFHYQDQMPQTKTIQLSSISSKSHTPSMVSEEPERTASKTDEKSDI